MSVPAKKLSQVSKAAELFALQCRSNLLPEFTREHPFAVKIGRRWRFDFSWEIPAGAFAVRRPIRLAVEIEGIVMRQVRIQDPRTKAITTERVMGGRHATIGGFKEDCVKYATASLLGWTVLRFEQSQVRSKFAVGMTMRQLHRMGWRAETSPSSLLRDG